MFPTEVCEFQTPMIKPLLHQKKKKNQQKNHASIHYKHQSIEKSVSKGLCICGVSETYLVVPQLIIYLCYKLHLVISNKKIKLLLIVCAWQNLSCPYWHLRTLLGLAYFWIVSLIKTNMLMLCSMWTPSLMLLGTKNPPANALHW